MKKPILSAALLAATVALPLAAADLFEGFRNPPSAARPRVWWHWMNGNVTKAGITADLEAMSKAGLGGAHLFDVGCGIPPGNVKFNTPSWDEHVDWAAREAERLGLELTLVNCSGFANAGGPWISPSNGMFYVRNTETAVRGGTALRGGLPKPKDDNGFYRDIAVLAFPRPPCEREPSGGLRVAAPSPLVRTVTSDEPVALGGFTFSSTYGWDWNVTAKIRVETSDDGSAWKESETIDVWLSNCGRSDCINGHERYIAFTRPTRARQTRITIAPEDPTFAYTLFRPELRRGLPDLNARTFRSYDITAPCTHEVGADGTVDPARILDLTDRLSADGHLDWTAPTGDDWIVLRIGYAANGAVNHPASSFGGGREVDKLDAAAVGRHFNAYAGRLAKGHKAVKAVLCDSYEVGTQNWTHGLEKTFAHEKGYSLVPYLIAFSGRVVGSARKTDEALWDFRRLISDLFVKNFVGESARKAREAGLRYAMEPYGNMSADCTHYAAETDLPMTEFWVTEGDGVPSNHVGHAETTRCVASAAHLHGRDTVDAEAFTAFPLKGGRWTKDPFGLKAMGDFYYTLGVTRMVYHRFAHQPWTEPARLPGMTMGQWGTHFERTETWWPMIGPWIAYQSRCQHLLASGHPANDLLVYVGDAVPNTGTPETAPEGWSWDVCGLHDLEELSVADGRIVPKAAPGVSYAALVVPTNRLITAASRAHLERLRAAGATLLKSGEKPSFAPDFTYSGTGEKVRAIQRRHDDGTRMWFVAYPSTNAATVRCSFRAVGTPELWNAETGERFRPYDWKSTGDRTEVTLPFQPCGSWFVVIRPGKVRSSLPTLEDPAKARPLETVKASGPWKLSFPSGWNCPAQVTLPELVSWTDIPNGEVRYFSGIAEYEKTLELPEAFSGEKGDRIFLDLGQVKNVAEITVNGRAYPPLWRPPFRADITDAVRAGATVSLKVRVANLWPNRLIGDEQKPADCEWGYEWNPLAIKEIPAWVKAGKPSPTGRLAFATWHHWTKDDALLESGLLGPVRIERMPGGDAETTPPKAQWVNIGSNSGKFGFDWAMIGATGLNLASCPQGMRRGFARLKGHRAKIADGAHVIIPLCPFTSVVPPGYDNRPVVDDNPLLAFDGEPSEEELVKFRDMLDACWKREFTIVDYADPMAPANRASYEKMVVVMKDFLAWCRDEGLKPVLVQPPAAKCFDTLFPDVFMKAYVYDFVRDVKPDDVPFLDYWKDSEFRSNRLWATSLFLNRTGRKLFTERVRRDVEALQPPCAELRRELRAFYPDECHGICKDSRQTNSVAAIGRELDDWAAAHPGFDALDIRRESYLLMRKHFVPFLFRNSPFYFEAGCNGGWCHNSISVPGRHVNRICARFYREHNLIPDAAFALQNARQWKCLALCCGPFVDDMHHIPPFRAVLAKGFGGIRAEVAAALAKCPADDALGRKELETALVGFDTIRAIQLAFADEAERRLGRPDELAPEEAANLRRIAESARRCPWEPPRTFFEGLNTLWFTREILGYTDGTDQFSLGRPDAWLADLYRADLAAGRITPEAARRMIGQFLVTADCHHDRTIAVDSYSDHEMEIPMSLGGCDRNGRPVWNELTKMFLDEHLACDCVFPKLHCRISASAPKAYLERIGDLLMKGHAVFTLLNDDRYIPQYVGDGFAPEDAREYVGVGCWNGFIDSVMDVDEANYLSIMGIVERTVHRDMELERTLRLEIDSIDDAKSIDEVREILYGNTIRFCRDILGEYTRWGRANAKVFPHPIYSMCLRGCAESRRDTTDAGVPPAARPKIITLGFIGNVVDTIAAINQICFVDKVCTVREYLDVVRSNWAGARGEELRRRAMNAPYWGDGSRFTTDELAWWMKSIRRDIDGCRNDQGGPYRFAVYTYREFMYWGAAMKATPDGRRDGDRLAQGFSPSEAKCKSGITTLMNAIGELPHECLYASNVNLTFDRSAMNAQLLAAILQVFCEKGSHMIQPNCNSVEELLDAQLHPERHQNLIVRVCGFSAKFIYLSKRWQDEVIARHRLR